MAQDHPQTCSLSVLKKKKKSMQFRNKGKQTQYGEPHTPAAVTKGVKVA
jgi:hypothetical protein